MLPGNPPEGAQYARFLLWFYNSYRFRRVLRAEGSGTRRFLAIENMLTLVYNYCADFSDTSYAVTCASNNGNVTRQQIGFGAIASAPAFAETQVYQYNDPANRLTQASGAPTPTASANWVEPNGFDAVGNRWVVASGVTGITLAPDTPVASSWFTAQNRISSWNYDAMGNLTGSLPTGSPAVPSRTFVYDGENRQAQATINGAVSTYTYDGDGRRVTAVTPNGTTTFVYDAEGRLAQEYLTAAPSANGPTYLTVDHLGSTRMVTDADGNVLKRYDYLPFGEELTAGTDGRTTQMMYNTGLSATLQDVEPMKFTGKERDAESGNDYFGARYDSSSMGRFLSPDPLGGDLTNPQSLNRYSYVLNNPLTNTDPTGLYTCTDSKDCSSKKDQALEKSLAGLRNSKNADDDVARGANAYGAANADNGVSVGFKDLSGSGKGGDTVSTVGTDADGNLRANSAITINSKDSGTDFTADVGHEGSHAADAQDVVKSGLENGDNTIHAGMNITPYQSEQRAYGVTNAILNSANESRNYSCGSGGCLLGRGASDIPGTVDRLLGSNPMYNQGGRPMSSTNQGPSVVNGVTPKATVPSVPH